MLASSLSPSLTPRYQISAVNTFILTHCNLKKGQGAEAGARGARKRGALGACERQGRNAFPSPRVLIQARVTAACDEIWKPTVPGG